ncbi:MAG TPA: SagB family peptide dehydrogenase [Ktedonobacteraceae bacterium]|nr:SagB family peptide dehydrogenase [Ktedonobacteraceae bacterium]
MEQKLIAAEAMARAVRLDPQFAMPQRPHFPAELVVVPMEDGLLVEGGEDSQVLRGKATRSLLPRLLPLLDGSRSLEQLAQAIPGVPAESIYNAVALLYTRGLLEDAAFDPQDADPARFDPHMLAFFRRYVDVTRVNRSALQALARLGQSQVVIYALGPHADLARAHMHMMLKQAGVGQVYTGEWGTDPGSLLDKQAGRSVVIVLVEGEDDQALLRQLDEQCARHNIPWLRASINLNGQVAELGPYFERGETPCYSCFARASFPPALYENREEKADQAQTSWLDARLWANMLVVEVIYLLSRISLLATGLNVTRYSLDDWSTQRLRFPKLPGCPNCRPAGVEMGPVETAVVYEDAVSFPSRHLLDPKSHQMHYRASNLELAHEGKRYPSAAQVQLPDRTELIRPRGTVLENLPGKTASPPGAELDLTRLATLLMLGAGIRYSDGNKASKLQRWSPTGGNLGSVELYVVARNVTGLEPGLYFYQPHEHTLAILERSGQTSEMDAFLREALPRESELLADAYVILTAAHDRVSHKYSAFAYRIIHLDAGVALGQMHMVASGLGLSAQTIQSWADDRIADRLDLEDIKEAITGVLALRGVSPESQEEEVPC